MRRTHEREIDGTRWTVNEFSATEGLRLLTRLTSLCGAPVAQAFEALPSTGLLDAKIDFSLIGKAISELTNRLDEDQVVDLIRRLVACTLADGEPVDRKFDLVFQGRYVTLFRVLAFVLEVNFKIPLADWLEVASATVAGQLEPAAGAA